MFSRSAHVRPVAAPSSGPAPRVYSPVTALAQTFELFLGLAQRRPKSANTEANEDGLDLVDDPRLLGNQVTSLAVRPSRVLLPAYRTTGSCAAKPRGGSTSPLEKYANFLLTLIERQPDLTLDEVVCAMRKRKLPGSRTAVWRFFQRHKITFKKKA